QDTHQGGHHELSWHLAVGVRHQGRYAPSCASSSRPCILLAAPSVAATVRPHSGGGFAGEFIRNAAQREWTATVGDLTVVSDPLTTSSSAFAEIGHERNGSFFP